MQIKNTSNDNVSCDKYRPAKEYKPIQEFIDNLPYIMMIIGGVAINALGFKLSIWGIIAGVVYFFYGVAGALWIILFLCPYCHYYNTRACPCGYGKIAAKLRQKSDENKFAEKFKKHIPAIIPLWIIPMIEGIIFLIIDFNRLMLFLTAAFVIDSFIILPLIARIYGCGHCPQKNDCPWMTKEKEISQIATSIEN
jgi:hypothetical protein